MTMRCAGRGFTLFETLFVIAILTITATALNALQPNLFRVQTNGRDQYVGIELMRACAERLLAVRRISGFSSVTSTACNGLGGIGNFAANPTVALTAADGTPNLTDCSTAGATCTASITVAKLSGPAASLSAITLQLSAY